MSKWADQQPFRLPEHSAARHHHFIRIPQSLGDEKLLSMATISRLTNQPRSLATHDTRSAKMATILGPTHAMRISVRSPSIVTGEPERVEQHARTRNGIDGYSARLNHRSDWNGTRWPRIDRISFPACPSLDITMQSADTLSIRTQM